MSHDHMMMDHSGMDHSGMDHSGMDHSGMDHSGMDHSGMDHSKMDHSGMNHGDMMMMQMTFYASAKVTILFDQWQTTGAGDLIGSCIGIFLLAILYEGLKYFREWLYRRHYVALNVSKITAPGMNGSEINQTITNVSWIKSILSCSHFIQTMLHFLQLVISYLLMLIVMTFNVWVCIAVVLGCTVGYFLFGWQKGYMVDITEHCH